MNTKKEFPPENNREQDIKYQRFSDWLSDHGPSSHNVDVILPKYVPEDVKPGFSTGVLDYGPETIITTMTLWKILDNGSLFKVVVDNVQDIKEFKGRKISEATKILEDRYGYTNLNIGESIDEIKKIEEEAKNNIIEERAKNNIKELRDKNIDFDDFVNMQDKYNDGDELFRKELDDRRLICVYDKEGGREFSDDEKIIHPGKYIINVYKKVGNTDHYGAEGIIYLTKPDKIKEAYYWIVEYLKENPVSISNGSKVRKMCKKITSRLKEGSLLE